MFFNCQNSKHTKSFQTERNISRYVVLYLPHLKTENQGIIKGEGNCASYGLTHYVKDNVKYVDEKEKLYQRGFPDSLVKKKSALSEVFFRNYKRGTKV